MITKYIFVDLDETLFHSRFLGVKHKGLILKDGERLIKLYTSNNDENAEFYGSRLRGGAHDLLTALRAIPNSKVMVLTSSVDDYAWANNVSHGLQFEYSDIFHRTHLQKGTVPDLGVTAANAKFYLIDNLPRHENRIKVQWIARLLPTRAATNYITVPEFLYEEDRPLDADLINHILQQINDLQN